jgi:hypothetical protein
MKRRSKKGQSMVEYAIGIGCVTAVCTLVLGGLGHASADIVKQFVVSSNDIDDQSADPSLILTRPQSASVNAGWTAN